MRGKPKMREKSIVEIRADKKDGMKGDRQRR